SPKSAEGEVRVAIQISPSCTLKPAELRLKNKIRSLAANRGEASVLVELIGPERGRGLLNATVRSDRVACQRSKLPGPPLRFVEKIIERPSAAMAADMSWSGPLVPRSSEVAAPNRSCCVERVDMNSVYRSPARRSDAKTNVKPSDEIHGCDSLAGELINGPRFSACPNGSSTLLRTAIIRSNAPAPAPLSR